MQSSRYYRQHAERERRLSQGISDRRVVAILIRLARDYDDIAIDLDSGAIDIVHPERLPQQDHFECDPDDSGSPED